MRQTITVKGAGGLKRRAAKALKLKNIDRLTMEHQWSCCVKLLTVLCCSQQSYKCRVQT